MFDFESDDAALKFRELLEATDGSEPCYDPFLVNPDGKSVRESPTDMFVENYANRGVSSAKAQEMCAPCGAKAECLAFALANGEPFGIWGGTTPKDRGYVRGKKVK